MDVEHAIGVGLEKRAMQTAHEARQQDQVDRPGTKDLDPRALIVDPGSEATHGGQHGLDPETSRALDHRGVGHVAQEDGDASHQITTFRGQRQRFEVAAPSRGENGEVRHGG